MRRRLDIHPLPFMEPDGSMYHVADNGVLVPFVHDDAFDPDGGQELGSMPQSYLSFTQDYVSRARYLAGSPHDNDLNAVESTSTPADVRKVITKLERAVLELRAGMLGRFSRSIHMALPTLTGPWQAMMTLTAKHKQRFF
jgi:hypothetical protein